MIVLDDGPFFGKRGYDGESKANARIIDMRCYSVATARPLSAPVAKTRSIPTI